MSNEVIIKAFLQAQREFPEIEKDSTADAGKYKYSYASLPAIQRVCFPILHNNGIAVSQVFRDTALETRLMHESGEEMISFLECSGSGLNPQDFGKKITYYRRYALCCLLGIAPDDDVDALGVSAPAKSVRPPGELPAVEFDDIVKPPKKPATKPSTPEPTTEKSDDAWTSSIPDDILDLVRANYGAIQEKKGDAKEWHTKTLKNLLDTKVGANQSVSAAIKVLGREQLEELLGYQKIKIGENNG